MDSVASAHIRSVGLSDRQRGKGKEFAFYDSLSWAMASSPDGKFLAKVQYAQNIRGNYHVEVFEVKNLQALVRLYGGSVGRVLPSRRKGSGGRRTTGGGPHRFDLSDRRAVSGLLPDSVRRGRECRLLDPVPGRKAPGTGRDPDGRGGDRKQMILSGRLFRTGHSSRRHGDGEGHRLLDRHRISENSPGCGCSGWRKSPSILFTRKYL